MDEKTKVIPTNLNQQSNAAQRPATPVPQQPVNRPPVQPAVNAQNSLLKPGHPGTVQKKRIITGVLAAGGLLGGAFLLTGLKNPDPPISGAAGELAGTASTPSDGSTASTSKMVSITTDHPVSDVLMDDLELEDAREVAREEMGSVGIFSHRGQLHATATEEEIAALTPEYRAEYLRGIVTHDITNETVNVDGREMEVKVAGMHDFAKVVYDNDGNYYYYDRNGEATVLENVSENEYGQLIRTNPITGEETPFNFSMTLKNVDQGVIDVSVYSSDVKIADNGVVISGTETPEEPEPIDTGTYLIGDGVAGWDSDLDGEIDVIDYTWNPGTPNPNFESEIDTPTKDILYVPETVDKTDREMAMDKVREIADEAGIDVRKIKIYQTDDGGYNYKVKGDDGKLKGHLTVDDLKSSVDENGVKSQDQETPIFGDDEPNDEPDDDDISEPLPPDEPDTYMANNDTKPYWEDPNIASPCSGGDEMITD